MIIDHMVASSRAGVPAGWEWEFGVVDFAGGVAYSVFCWAGMEDHGRWMHKDRTR